MGAVFWSSVRYLFVTLPDCFFLADQQSRDEKTTELREFLSVEPKSYRKDARLKREKRNCGVRCDVRISLLNAFESTHPTADGNVSRLNENRCADGADPPPRTEAVTAVETRENSAGISSRLHAANKNKKTDDSLVSVPLRYFSSIL